MIITINEYIVANPTICHGQLTFKGTRIMVWLILDMLAAGETITEILKDYPALTVGHIHAALSCAARATEKSRVKMLSK